MKKVYISNIDANIVFTIDEALLIGNDYDEVPLDPIKDPKSSLNNLKRTVISLIKTDGFIPALGSKDGVEWKPTFYFNDEIRTVDNFRKDELLCIDWKYIVPLDKFDFNNIKSNKRKSII